MKNKVLIQLLVPDMDASYDIFIPVNIRIGTLIELLNKSLGELTNGVYSANKNKKIYNTISSEPYSINDLIRNTNIRNGSTIVII